MALDIALKGGENHDMLKLKYSVIFCGNNIIHSQIKCLFMIYKGILLKTPITTALAE